MKKLLIGVAIIVGIFSFYTTAYFYNSTKSESHQAIQLDAGTIHNLVNEERTKAGLETLEWDITLESTASHKTNDMIKYDYFSHDRNGVLILSDVKKIKPECKEAGENLAETNQDAQTVVDGWLNSPTHRENMLHEGYDTTGIYVDTTYDEEHGEITIITQHFCDL